MRTVTSRKSGPTHRRRCGAALAVSGPVTPITRANPAWRAASTTAASVATTTHRPGRAASRSASSVSVLADTGLSTNAVPTPISCSCRTRVTPDSESAAAASSANSTASWRRGSMMTGSNLTTTNLLTVVNVAHAGLGQVSGALVWSARTDGVAARRWRARATNACGGLWRTAARSPG